MASDLPDYWDHATQLELAVLANDEKEALVHLRNALAAVRESWEPKTTVNNLELIIEARKKRSESVEWVERIANELRQQADT